MKIILGYLVLLTFSVFALISCDKVLLEKNISDKAVQLVAPTNNAQFFSTSVSFTWQPVQYASNYRLQIAKPSFAAPVQIVLDTLIASSAYTKQLTIGQYEWRVKALNSAYETPYKSQFFSVVSNSDFQNNTVTLLSPSNSLITKVTTQTLSWQSVLGATQYQLQIYDNSSTIVNDQTVTTTTQSYTFPEGGFQWRVRASNGTDNTLFTSRSILVDTTNPNTPTLSSPTNASTQTAGQVSFQWNRTPLAGSVEKDSIYIYTDSSLTTLQSKSESSSPYSVTLPTGVFYWFVKSFDQAGNVGTRSTVFNFTLN